MSSMPTTSALLDPLVALQHLDVREGMTVGDLGCGGHGHFTFPLASLVGNNGKVFAVDILKTALTFIESRLRQENIRQVKTIWSDLEIMNAPGLIPQSLDRGVLVHTLSQAKNPETMLKCIRRLFKNSGRLMIIEWRPEGTLVGPPVEHRLSSEVVEKVANTNGFKVVENFLPDQYHYGFLLEAVA